MSRQRLKLGISDADGEWILDEVRTKPFNSTPMGVNLMSFGSPHVRPMGCTCGWAGEIKKSTHPGSFTALFNGQVRAQLMEQQANRQVRAVSRSIPPRWGSIRGFARLPARTPHGVGVHRT